MKDLYGAIKRSWLAARQVHIDAYMCVEQISGYDVVICEKDKVTSLADIETEKKLFFVNLGFYQEGVMAERHERLLEVASSEDEVRTELKNRFKLRYDEIINFHIDDCHLLYENLDVEIPDDIESKQKEFTVCLKKVRSGSDLYPKVVVGYYKIP